MTTIGANMKTAAATIIFTLLFTATNIVSQTIDYHTLQAEVQNHLRDLPFESFQIDLPQIPTRIYNICEFGARGDGHTLNTDAINQAIAKCAAAGGGTVLIPAGLWLTGPIVMQSKVNLHLARGAVVTFSRQRELYPVIKIPHRNFEAHPLIYGVNLKDVAITGEGILEGSGDAWRPVKKSKQTAQQWKNLLNSGGVVDKKNEIWWPSQAALDGENYLRNLRANQSRKALSPEDLQPARDYLRPNMLLLINCERVLFDGITIANSPRFALYPNWCQSIIIRNVKINNEWWAQNGDGIDLSSCQNALVYNCTVTAGDDALCLKASSAPPTEQPVVKNIVFSDCIVYHGHGGFVVGSNTEGGIRNVLVNNCDFIGTDLGIRFKSARDRGGLVENIFIKNIFMKDIVGAALYFSTYYQEFAQTPYDTTAVFPVTATTPIFRHIVLDSIYSIGSQQIATIIGLPEMPINNLKIRNGVFSAQQGVEIKNANGIQFVDLGLYSNSTPLIRLKQCQDITFNKIQFNQQRLPLLRVAGLGNSDIIFRKTAIPSPERAIVLDQNVQPDVVQIQTE